MEFTSRGVGNAGLTTGIIGTGLGVLNSGLFGNILNQNNQYVSKETFDVQMKLVDAQKQNAIMASELSTEVKISDAFKAGVERENKIRDELKTELKMLEQKVDSNAAAQAVINAQYGSQINLNNSKIAQLFTLTQLTIPNSSINPGWGNVTVTPVFGGTATAA